MQRTTESDSNYDGLDKMDVSDLLININRDKRDERESDFMIEQGDAYGIDFLIKYDKSFFSLWTTYSLSYVTRNDGNIVYFTNFDRRHNLNIVSSYTFGKDKNWELLTNLC